MDLPLNITKSSTNMQQGKENKDSLSETSIIK